MSLPPTPNTTETAAFLLALNDSLFRLTDGRLQSQRYEVDERKLDEMKAIALGAKLDKALNRRLTSQDAVFTKKK